MNLELDSHEKDKSLMAAEPLGLTASSLVDTNNDFDFYISYDLGLALPIAVYGKNNIPEKISSTFNHIDFGDKILHVTIEANWKNEPFSSLDYDVLNAVINLAHEQLKWPVNIDVDFEDHNSRVTVQYNKNILCKKAGKSVSRWNVIQKSLEKIDDQVFTIKRLTFCKKTGEETPRTQRIRLIQLTDTVSRGQAASDVENRLISRYLTLDARCLSSASGKVIKDFYPLYLKCACGPERRILVYLYTKRMLDNGDLRDSLAFKFSEVFKLLRVEQKSRPEKLIRESLKGINRKLGNIFEFKDMKIRGESDWNCVIEFISNNEYKHKEASPFVQRLNRFFSTYKKDPLRNIGLDVEDIEVCKKELNLLYIKKTGTSKYHYLDDIYLDPGETAIEISFWIHFDMSRPPIKSFKRYAQKVLLSLTDSTVEFPIGYRPISDKLVERSEKARIKDIAIKEDLRKKEEEKEKKKQDRESALFVYEKVKNRSDIKKLIQSEITDDEKEALQKKAIEEINDLDISLTTLEIEKSIENRYNVLLNEKKIEVWVDKVYLSGKYNTHTSKMINRGKDAALLPVESRRMLN